MNALFFAPRYLLARVGTYGDGLMGVTKYAAGAQPGEAWRLPGAAIRSTRKSEQEIHMKSLISFIGFVVYYTEFINWLGGHETDRRPIVDGRYNTNFYNIRFGGQELNLFGPSIGLVAGLTHMARGDVTQAMRSMGSGMTRIFIDLFTGFDFHGKETPIGVTSLLYDEDEDVLRREFFNPGALSRYISQLIAPIAVSQIWGQAGKLITEDIPSLMKGEPEAGKRALATLGAIPLEFAGARIGQASPTDEKDDIALEKYGMTFRDMLDGPGKNKVKAEHVDTLFKQRFGDQERTGPKGELYKQKDAAIKYRQEGLQSKVDKYQAGPILGDTYDPEALRRAGRIIENTYVQDVYGKWSTRKKRLVGGINELLYDRDKESEDFEPGTLEYDLARYYEINEKSMSEEGEMDWETRDRLASDFWNSITTVRRLFEVLDNIRTMEMGDPEGYRRSKEAGRYAAAYEWTDVDGWTGNYYDLENHPNVISELSVATGYTPGRIREWLDMEFWRRKPSAESTETGEKIADALAASERDGMVFSLKDEFVTQAPTSWQIAMYEAGYKHKYAGIIRDNLRKEQASGLDIQAYDYDAELKKLLHGKIKNQG